MKRNCHDVTSKKLTQNILHEVFAKFVAQTKKDNTNIGYVNFALKA